MHENIGDGVFIPSDDFVPCTSSLAEVKNGGHMDRDRFWATVKSHRVEVDDESEDEDDGEEEVPQKEVLRLFYFVSMFHL